MSICLGKFVDESVVIVKVNFLFGYLVINLLIIFIIINVLLEFVGVWNFNIFFLF